MNEWKYAQPGDLSLLDLADFINDHSHLISTALLHEAERLDKDPGSKWEEGPSPDDACGPWGDPSIERQPTEMLQFDKARTARSVEKHIWKLLYETGRGRSLA